MLREGQSKMIDSMSNPLSAMPGFEAMKAQQEAFMKAMTGGLSGGWSGPHAEEADGESEGPDTSELDDIRAQLAAMQEQLAKMNNPKKK